MVLREGKVEDRAWTVLGRRRQPASMRLENGTANGKPHAHAPALGGVESIKNPFHALRECLKSLRIACQATNHDVDHGYFYEGFAGFRQEFIILTEAAIPS